MKVTKQQLLVTKDTKTFPIAQYVGNVLKIFDLGHPTACVYKFIGNYME